MDQAKKAAAFKALHERKKLFVIPNPWDGGSAKLLASMGFEALTTTSAGLAFVLGKPDGGVTREQSLWNAKLIIDSVDLPVAADLENGFGDRPEDAAETIRQAAAVGLVGGSIEDFTRDEADADLRLRPGRRARRGRGGGGPRAAFPFHVRRALPRTSSTASATSTTRSGASRPTRRPAPTCCSRRACPTSRRSAPVCASVSKPVNVVDRRARIHPRSARGGGRPPGQRRRRILPGRA